MCNWIDLETRLQQNKAIDKNIQEDINKAKNIGKKVLLRVIVIAKHVAKYKLAFRKTKEKKINEQKNVTFYSLIK